jgi:hypothetical protein
MLYQISYCMLNVMAIKYRLPKDILINAVPHKDYNQSANSGSGSKAAFDKLIK